MFSPHRSTLSRIRGGSNATLIRVSSGRVSAFVDRMDVLIPFSRGAVKHVEGRIGPETVLLGDQKLFSEEYPGDHGIDIPFSQIAAEIGGPIYSNTAAVALLLGLFQVEAGTLERYLRRQFSGKDETIVRKNVEAARRGFQASEEILRKGRLKIDVARDPRVRDEILLDGAEALAMGGRCGRVQLRALLPHVSFDGRGDLSGATGRSIRDRGRAGGG